MNTTALPMVDDIVAETREALCDIVADDTVPMRDRRAARRGVALCDRLLDAEAVYADATDV